MKKILFFSFLLFVLITGGLSADVWAGEGKQEPVPFVTLPEKQQAQFEKYFQIALEVLQENNLPAEYLGQALLSQSQYRLEMTYGFDLSPQQLRSLHYAITHLIARPYNQTLHFEQYNQKYPVDSWESYRIQCEMSLDLIFELVRDIALETEDFGKWFQRASWYEQHEKRFER